MIKQLLITTFAAAILTGCTTPTTKADFDCPVQDGVPACLTTSEADSAGDLPKSGAAAKADDVVKIESESSFKADSLMPSPEKVVKSDAQSYDVRPLIKQPGRQFGSTERMWFSAWEDKENDLYIDQQYVYWTEKGQWIIAEATE